jgi:CheY-like chemotaxis protein
VAALRSFSAKAWRKLVAVTNSSCPACVLVVEDDLDIREMLGELLRDEGYETALAKDGQQALELLATIARPCLVLADLIMPVMDGWQLLNALSRDDRLATIPVLIMSGVSATNLPADRTVIKKPADISLLMQIVHEHCCGSRGAGTLSGEPDDSFSTNP